MDRNLGTFATSKIESNINISIYYSTVVYDGFAYLNIGVFAYKDNNNSRLYLGMSVLPTNPFDVILLD